MKQVIGVMPLFDEDKDSLWMLPGYFNDVGVKRSFDPMMPRISPALCALEILKTFEIAHFFFEKMACCLRSASVGAEQTSTGCLAPHVFRGLKVMAFSCKHEKHDLLTLASF